MPSNLEISTEAIIDCLTMGAEMMKIGLPVPPEVLMEAAARLAALADQPSDKAQQEPVNYADWPERIYLQRAEDEAVPFKGASLEDTCWCPDQQFEFDVPYVRADLASTNTARKEDEQRKRLRERYKERKTPRSVESEFPPMCNEDYPTSKESAPTMSQDSKDDERPTPVECCKFVSRQVRAFFHAPYADRIDELVKAHAELQARSQVERVPDENQLIDWLMHSAAGDRLSFAGVPSPYFLGLSRVRMCDSAGNDWTLTAGIKEGWEEVAKIVGNILAAAPSPAQEK